MTSSDKMGIITDIQSALADVKDARKGCIDVLANKKLDIAIKKFESIERCIGYMTTSDDDAF